MIQHDSECCTSPCFIRNQTTHRDNSHTSTIIIIDTPRVIDIYKCIIASIANTDHFTGHIAIRDTLGENHINPLLPLLLFVEAEKILVKHMIQSLLGYLVFQKVVVMMSDTIKITTPEYLTEECELLASSILGNIFHWVLLDKPYTAFELAEQLHERLTYGLLIRRPQFSDVKGVN